MKIGIIGAGTVGASMGRALRRAGHEVMFSSRTPEGEKMQALRDETGASVGSVEETVAFGEVLIMALRWDAVPDAIAESSGWSGKVLIDLTNRFGGESAAQELARLTGARVVKAFNTIGAEHYTQPEFSGQAATMLIAGDDAEAKQITMRLAQDIGFEPVDAGPLTAAIHLERLAELWVHLAMRAGLGRNFAFKLIRR